jgi:DNA repair protein RadC
MSYSDHKKKDFCLPKSIPQTPQIAGFFLSPAYRLFIMKKMKDVPERDRPREKIVRKGVSSLTDICGLLKDQKGTIRYDDLQSVDGVGPSKAAQIMACFELGRRYCESDDGCVKVTKPQDVLPLGIVADIRYKRQEHFICITLNGAGEVLASRIITVGLLNHSLVHPREVFADAITDRAASVICVHNHPSGSLDPSPQDIAITTQLREAGLLLGIQMIDHIIVTKAGYLSMKERGLL